MAKSLVQRISDLEAAAKMFARKRNAVLTMDEMAALYGLTKPAFHNLHKTIPDFPEICEKKGLTNYYPAKAVIKCLLTYLSRHQTAEGKKARRQSAMLGQGPAAKEDYEPRTEAVFSPSEQLRLWDLRDRIEQSEAKQMGLIRSDDAQQTAERVFTLISLRFGNASDNADPNGILIQAEHRDRFDEAGRKLILEVYEEMRDLLSDADERSSGVEAPRNAPSRSGRMEAPRKGR